MARRKSNSLVLPEADPHFYDDHGDGHAAHDVSVQPTENPESAEGA